MDAGLERRAPLLFSWPLSPAERETLMLSTSRGGCLASSSWSWPSRPCLGYIRRYSNMFDNVGRLNGKRMRPSPAADSPPPWMAWRTWEGVFYSFVGSFSTQRGTNPVSFLFLSPRPRRPRKDSEHPLPTAQKRGHRMHLPSLLLLDLFLHVCSLAGFEAKCISPSLGKQTRTFSSLFSINPPINEKRPKPRKPRETLSCGGFAARPERCISSFLLHLNLLDSTLPWGPSDPLRGGKGGPRGDAGMVSAEKASPPSSASTNSTSPCCRDDHRPRPTTLHGPRLGHDSGSRGSPREYPATPGFSCRFFLASPRTSSCCFVRRRSIIRG